MNVEEEMFGYERTTETVREACAEGIGAEELVDRLMSKAREFAEEEPQADDMRCVVVRVENRVILRHRRVPRLLEEDR